jgi:hypothetical protein
MADTYILDGKRPARVDTLTWARWFEDADNRRVAEDTIGEARVSTVFLGLDHGYHGTPILFETMVFGGPFDGEQERYATYDEAEAGHAAMVARVRDA